MAMNKILYALPALAMLGLLPAADADTVQEKIDRLQERIAELEAKIDRNPDSEKVAKWEARIAKFEARIAELEARLETTTQKITKPAAPQERSERATADDGYPPTLVFADYNRGSGVLTLEFHETVDIDSVDLSKIGITGTGGHNFGLRDMTVTTTGDSDTVSIQLTSFWKNRVNSASPNVNAVSLSDGFADDLNGNQNVAHSHEFGVRTDPPGPPPDTTPPQFVSATLDMNDGTLTVVFDEAVDIDTVRLAQWWLSNTDDVADRQSLGDSQLSTAADSQTVTVTLSQAELGWVSDKSFTVLISGKLGDPSGNIYFTPANGELVTVIPLTDETPPVITPRGSDPLAHELGTPYTDPGADADDGSAVATDASAVDVNVAGDYTVTYTATDAHGNEGTAERTVQVRDTTGPTVASATFDVTADTMTIVFDEAIDFSEVYLENIGLGRYTLAGTTFDAGAPDSDTLVLAAHWSTAGNVLGLENPELDFGRNSVRDTAGNGLQAVTVPIALANVPVPDATVTITAAGTFVEDAGTIDIQLGGDMTIEVMFVNEHGSDHTVLADLISWHFGHQSEDIPIQSGQSATVTFTVQGDAPRIGTDPERANVYLVFGAADIPGTPEHEPDTITGDHAIKVRIVEPAS